MEAVDFQVLVVDDSPSLRALFGKALREAGFTVFEAADGPSALEILAQRKIDLVTLDVEMPGIDGFETCRRIRFEPRTADIPVLMITTRGREEEIQKGFNAGVTEYFVKPFQVEKLMVAVSAYERSRESAPLGTLVIVGGQPIENHIIRSAAEIARFQTREYPSGKAFLAEQPACDLAIIDLDLTDTNGLDLVSMAREKLGFDTPLMVISNDPVSLSISRAYIRGATDHLTRPFDADILAAKIQSIFRARRYQFLLEENRVQQGRLELFQELHVALAHHLNNILTSFLLHIGRLEKHCDREDMKSSLASIRGAAAQVAAVLKSLKKSSEGQILELETYLDEVKMLKIDR